MLRDEDLDNQLQMLDRLPDMIKILRSYPLPQNTLFLQNIRSTSATCADIFRLGTPNQGTSSPQSKYMSHKVFNPPKKTNLCIALLFMLFMNLCRSPIDSIIINVYYNI